MKKLILLMMCFYLTGCAATNPPEAPKAEGEWETLHTTISDITTGV